MATVDLFNLIFIQLLKISPDLISRYSTVQDQILYLLLIPSVIIILFVWTFGYWIMGNGHNGLRILISLIAYIYIVWSGWYGSWIIPVILAWFPIVLVTFFLFFILSRILHPMNIGGASKVMKAGFEKIPQKGKEINALRKQIDIIKKKIRHLESEKSKMSDPQARSVLSLEITDLKQKKKEIEHEIDILEE
jgi:hypothetical protein